MDSSQENLGQAKVNKSGNEPTAQANRKRGGGPGPTRKDAKPTKKGEKKTTHAPKTGSAKREGAAGSTKREGKPQGGATPKPDPPGQPVRNKQGGQASDLSTIASPSRQNRSRCHGSEAA